MSSQYYKSLLKTVRTDLSDYKKRKSQLEAICNNYALFDSYATDLNMYCDLVLSNSHLGMKISGGSNDASSIFGQRDSGTGDNYLSSSKSYIHSEIRRVQNKIDELEGSVKSYNNKIEQEEKKEKEAAQKAKQNK